MKNKKVLVTGGTGFIGSVVVSSLVGRGHEVVVYDLAAWDEKADNTEYIKGDIFDAKHLSEVLSSCDSVIHMVGLADARVAQDHPQMSFDLNVRSTQMLLEVIRDSNINIPRVILPSSASIYGVVDRSPISEDTTSKPTNIYSYHKLMAEQLAECYAKNYNINVTVLRLFNVYGTKGGGILNILVEKAKKGEPIMLYGEKQKRDFIHISDVADVFAGVLETSDSGLGIYNVGTGVGRSIEDIVKLVGEYFSEMQVEHGEYNAILYDLTADITKIEKAIGFNPDKSDRKLKETIEKMINKEE
jgi:UDP-glucose 4-epimerase